MKEIVIYGENRHEKATKTRIACRGVILSESKLLLVHEELIDQWLIPGGGLEAGETLEECCIREMAEETGSLVQPKQCYLTIHEYYEQWHLISHYFLCDRQGETQQHLTDYEAKAGLLPKWLPLEEALELFGGYRKYEGVNEMRRGAYLREYTALSALPESVIS